MRLGILDSRYVSAFLGYAAFNSRGVIRTVISTTTIMLGYMMELKYPNAMPLEATMNETSPRGIMPKPTCKHSLFVNLTIFAPNPQPINFENIDIITSKSVNIIKLPVIPSNDVCMPIFARNIGVKNI